MQKLTKNLKQRDRHCTNTSKNHWFKELILYMAQRALLTVYMGYTVKYALKLKKKSTI